MRGRRSSEILTSVTLCICIGNDLKLRCLLENVWSVSSVNVLAWKEVEYGFHKTNTSIEESISVVFKQIQSLFVSTNRTRLWNFKIECTENMQWRTSRRTSRNPKQYLEISQGSRLRNFKLEF